MPAQSRPQSIINYSELRAQKARLGLCYRDLTEKTGISCSALTCLFNGAETLNVQTIKRLAAELGLRVIVDFQPIEKGGEGEQS